MSSGRDLWDVSRLGHGDDGIWIAVRQADRTLWIDPGPVSLTRARVEGKAIVAVHTPRGVIHFMSAKDYMDMNPDMEGALSHFAKIENLRLA